MTSPSLPQGMVPQTLRLVCLTSSLPDAVKKGSIPSRETLSVVDLPAGADGFFHSFLRKAPHGVQGMMAADCAWSGARDGRFALEPVAALNDRDYGVWHGKALADLPPEGLNTLLHDVDFAPPAGESQRQFHTRTGAWLDNFLQKGADRFTQRPNPSPGSAPAGGRNMRPVSGLDTILIVARPAVVRALACHILGGGPEMASRLDIAPQTTSLFTCHAGRWRVRALGVG